MQWRTRISAGRTPTAALTAGVATLAPAPAGTPTVHHHAQFEVYYILGCEGMVTIRGRGYPVTPGSAVFIRANLEHAMRNTESQPLRRLFGFTVDAFDEVQYVFPEQPASGGP